MLKLLRCLLFGHKEWRPSQVRDFSFISPVDPERGDQWEVCLCGRCKLVYWRFKA